MLQGHGDDGYLYGNKIVANFSSNVYYPGFSEKLQSHLISCLSKVKNYPESEGQSLKKSLAYHHHLEPDQVIITNGATEAFYLIAHAFRGKNATIVVPTFSEYEDACVVNDLSLNFLNWESLTGQSSFFTDLAFICNPNNPTGALLSEAILNEFISNHPQTTFVIDEAYLDFTANGKSSVELIKLYPNLIVVKSLTKAYAIPGLRLGYILGNVDLISRLNKYKKPWSVNVLAVEAGKFIMENLDQLKVPVHKILHETDLLIKKLNSYPQLKTYPTTTNFILCKTEVGTAVQLKEFLVERFGVLIRDASNFRGLTPQHFRIATQSASENDLLIKGIDAWIKSF